MKINVSGYQSENNKSSNIANDDLSLRYGKEKKLMEMLGFMPGIPMKNYVMLWHGNNRVSLVLFLRYNSCLE